MGTDSQTAAGRAASDKLCVLVIEDEATIIEFLRTGLTYEGYQVSVAESGRAGLELATAEAFDLIILDLMLPDVDGLDVCRRLRARGNETPIIILTARQEVTARIAGLDSGGDDYLVKPFVFGELLARIRVALRRHGKSLEPTLLHILDLELNAETREVRRAGRSIELTPTEFALLELFMRHPRRVYTRETLVHRIWGYDFMSDTNFIEVHIGHLREKIGDKPPRLIRTVYGVGYVLRPSETDESLV